MKPKLYWEFREQEQEMIAEEEFVHHVIEIKLMYIQDFKSGKLNILDFIIKEKVQKHKPDKSPTKLKGKFRIELDKRLKISDVAKRYGFKVSNNKMVCPFHDDKDPSLSLNDVGNCFYCFGCHTTGDIIEFIRLLMETKKMEIPNGN